MVVLNDIGLTLEIIGFALFLFVPIQETYNIEFTAGKQAKMKKIKEWMDRHHRARHFLRYGGITLIITGLIMQYSFLNTDIVITPGF